MIMNEPKNHHYVPVFYLNYWGKADDESRYKKVQAFRFYNGHFVSKRRSTKYICKREGLNLRKSQNIAEVYKIENFLCQIDSDASLVHKKIIQKGPHVLTNQERSVYIRFLMSLKVRQPDAVQAMKEYGSGFATEELNSPSFIKEYLEVNNRGQFPDTPEELIRDVLPDLIPNFGVDAMVRVITGADDSKFHSLFCNMHWFVIDFSAVLGNLLTCDNPHYASAGLSDPKCIFAMPLSPKKAFFAVHDKEIKKKILNAPTKKLIQMLNESMVHQALDWVIDADDSNEILIESFFGKSRKSPISLV